MQFTDSVGTDANSLEHSAQSCDTTEETKNEDAPKSLVAILFEIGMEQERIIARMKLALDANRGEEVVELAKELVYGKK